MELIDFLTLSVMAKKVKLPGKIVLHRTSSSPADIASIRASGVYGPIPLGEEVCELEVNGIVLASGKIVQKGKNFYFKVTKLTKEERG